MAADINKTVLLTDSEEGFAGCKISDMENIEGGIVLTDELLTSLAEMYDGQNPIKFESQIKSDDDTSEDNGKNENTSGNSGNGSSSSSSSSEDSKSSSDTATAAVSSTVVNTENVPTADVNCIASSVLLVLAGFADVLVVIRLGVRYNRNNDK